MRYFSFGSFFFALLFSANVIAQNYAITGKVLDQKDNKSVIGASVFYQDLTSGNMLGANTDLNGNFRIIYTGEFPVVLGIRSVGYKERLFTVNNNNYHSILVLLEQDFDYLSEVSVYGEKVDQKTLTNPKPIEKINSIQLQETASYSFFETVANMRGVDVTTQSILVNTVNTRGFNDTENKRFLQLVDGIDMQAAGLNIPLANIIGPTDLDVDNLELRSGSNSTIYGNRAFNGLLHIATKSPFEYEGLSFSAKYAVNGLNGGRANFFELGANPIADYQIRYAKRITKNFAVKLDVGYLKGVDFSAGDYDNIGSGLRFENREESPGYDGVNTYGDEVGAFLNLRDSLVYVTRTGYNEEDLVDYEVRNLKANLSFHYRFRDSSELVFINKLASVNSMITMDNRVRLEDFMVNIHGVTYKSKNFRSSLYTSFQNSGNSYDAGVLANNLNTGFKSDELWFRQFWAAFNGSAAFPGGNGSYSRSRSFADSNLGVQTGQFQPGTDEFEIRRQEIIRDASPGSGALIDDNTWFLHYDAKYNYSLGDVNFISGANYRFTNPGSNGTVFTDSVGNNVTNYEVGVFTEVHKSVIKDKFDTYLNLRIDKSENFDPKFSLGISSVYQFKQSENIRIGLQRSYRFPTVREQFFDRDLGYLKFVGGLDQVHSQYDLVNNSVYANTLDLYNQAVLDDMSYNRLTQSEGLNFEQARLNNLAILESGIIRSENLNQLRPELAYTLDVAYRKVLKNRIYFDVNYYLNLYQDFIGAIRIIKPQTSPDVDLFAASGQVNNAGQSDQFFVYANANDLVISQGLDFTFDATTVDGFNFVLNTSFAQLIQSNDDPVIPAFNTPFFKSNVSIGHRNLIDNVGFKISWRYRSEFYWESAFATGRVFPYNTFDFQFNFRLPKLNSTMKLGSSNFFNEKFSNTFGGPGIEAIWYVNFTTNLFTN